MDTFLKLFSLLIATVMLFSTIIACTDNGDAKKETENNSTGVTTTATTTVNTTTTAPSTYTPPITTTASTTTSAVTTTTFVPSTNSSGEIVLPDHKWEQDIFYILGRQSNTDSSLTKFEIYRDKKSGGVIDDAVWTRNQRLEQKYEFIVEQNLVTNVNHEITGLYNAQDDVYDLVIYSPADALKHAANGYLLNLKELPYINLSHSAWDSKVNSELSINGNLYFTTNKFLLQDKTKTYVIYHNRELVEKYKLDSLESMVTNNRWTKTEFEEISRLHILDIDKGGAGGIGDSFGITAESYTSFVALIYGGGFTLGSNSNDGKLIRLTGPTQNNISIIDRFGDLWFDETLLCSPKDFTSNDSSSVRNIFFDERSMFYVSNLSEAQTIFEECNFEIGVLPLPKVDKYQENYYSYVDTAKSSMLAIPCTVADPSQVSFYLEAISEESCDTSYQGYLDYLADRLHFHKNEADKLNMIDICLNSAKYDIVRTLDPGGLYSIISQNLPQFKTNIFNRLYNSKGHKPQIELESFISSFED